MRLLGKKIVDFKERGTDKRIVGTKLFFVYRDDRTEGLCCDSKFFSEGASLYSSANNIRVGTSVDFKFLPNGSLCGLSATEEDGEIVDVLLSTMPLGSILHYLVSVHGEEAILSALGS